MSSDDSSSDDLLLFHMGEARKKRKIAAATVVVPPASRTTDRFLSQQLAKLKKSRRKNAQLTELEHDRDAERELVNEKHAKAKEELELLRQENQKQKLLAKMDLDNSYEMGNELIFRKIKSLPMPFIEPFVGMSTKDYVDEWNMLMMDNEFTISLKTHLNYSGALNETVPYSEFLCRLLFTLVSLHPDPDIQGDCFVSLSDCITGTRILSSTQHFPLTDDSSLHSLSQVSTSGTAQVSKWAVLMEHELFRLPKTHGLPKEKSFEAPWVPSQKDFFKMFSCYGADFKAIVHSDSKENHNNNNNSNKTTFPLGNFKKLLLILGICLTEYPLRYTIEEKINFFQFLCRCKLDSAVADVVHIIQSTLMVVVGTIFPSENKLLGSQISQNQSAEQEAKLTKQLVEAFCAPVVSRKIRTLVELCSDLQDIEFQKIPTTSVRAISFSLLTYICAAGLRLGSLADADIVPPKEAPSVKQIIEFLKEVKFVDMAPQPDTDNLPETCHLLSFVVRLIDLSLGVSVNYGTTGSETRIEFETLTEILQQFEKKIHAGQSIPVVDLIETVTQVRFKHNSISKWSNSYIYI